jgi:hypothetical protein
LWPALLVARTTRRKIVFGLPLQGDDKYWIHPEGVALGYNGSGFQPTFQP